MTPPEALYLTDLAELANRDPEFRIAARFWDCALRIEAGSFGRTLRIEGGQIVAVDAAEGDWDLRIAAPPEEWAPLLEPVPRPFYQDLWGAMTHHGFELAGDLERHLFPYYSAVRRLLEILRTRSGARDAKA